MRAAIASHPQGSLGVVGGRGPAHNPKGPFRGGPLPHKGIPPKGPFRVVGPLRGPGGGAKGPFRVVGEGWAKGQHLLKVAAPKTRLESYVHVLMRVKDTKHAHFNKITAKLYTQNRILDAVSDVSDMAVCSLRVFMCTHRSL